MKGGGCVSPCANQNNPVIRVLRRVGDVSKQQGFPLFLCISKIFFSFFGTELSERLPPVRHGEDWGVLRSRGGRSFFWGVCVGEGVRVERGGGGWGILTDRQDILGGGGGRGPARHTWEEGEAGRGWGNVGCHAPGCRFALGLLAKKRSLLSKAIHESRTVEQVCGQHDKTGVGTFAGDGLCVCVCVCVSAWVYVEGHRRFLFLPFLDRIPRSSEWPPAHHG